MDKCDKIPSVTFFFETRCSWSQCLNCRGWGIEPPTVFSTPFPSNTLSNYVLGVSYMLYTYDLYHNFGRILTVEKFNHCLELR